MGVYIFGIWSSLTLLQQYLSYSGLGLNFAANIELSIKNDNYFQYKNQIISTAISITTVVSIIICITLIIIDLFFHNSFFSFEGQEYIIPIAVLSGLTNIQQLMINIYRSYGHLKKIIWSESLLAIMSLGVLFFIGQKNLIAGSIGSMILAQAISLGIFLFRTPFTVRFNIAWIPSKKLLLIGIPLLIYNVSYAMITMLARTIVGVKYSTIDMGLYSFASAISGIAMVAVESIAWLLFPQILSKLSQPSNPELTNSLIEEIKNLYTTSVFFTVLFVILFLPLLLYIIPAYSEAKNVLVILLISQIAISYSYAYNCFAMAMKRQILIAFSSIFSVIVIGGLSLSAAQYNLSIMWIACSVLAGSTIFSLLQFIIKNIQLKNKFLFNISNFISPGNIIVIMILITHAFYSNNYIIVILGIFIFIYINIKYLSKIYKLIFSNIKIN